MHFILSLTHFVLLFLGVLFEHHKKFALYCCWSWSGSQLRNILVDLHEHEHEWLPRWLVSCVALFCILCVLLWFDGDWWTIGSKGSEGCEGLLSW